MTIPCPTSRLGWQAGPPPSASPLVKAWLSRPGALTAGLRALGAFRLRVLAEYSHGVPPDEAHGMLLAPGTPVWVREIVMSVDGVDAVMARSLTPLPASHGVWQNMRKLRTRPLADMLYHDRSIRRSAFACSPVARGVALRGPARGTLPPENREHAVLWARRSVFWRAGQPLLVTECFMPGFWAAAAARPQALHHQRL
ncbi:chorismate--pyruvate lyase family protein [Bordetella genomosp. 13]|uniref:chorismate--pyruvate lyase family protein n=1 Tax=Bordetella genomosp. 13 TaxID=463040 RepID=UPI00119EEB8F|nr:chorismate lyase [Bordetella genomosp. 13]